MKKDNIKWFIILHIIIVIISASSIVAKAAGKYPFLSIKWILLYGCVVGILGFYAIAWQQVIKHLPLIVAYANKAVTTIWGLVWGLLITHEQITLQKVIGAAIVIIGVYFVVSGDEEVTSKKDNKVEESKEVQKNA